MLIRGSWLSALPSASMAIDRCMSRPASLRLMGAAAGGVLRRQMHLVVHLYAYVRLANM